MKKISVMLVYLFAMNNGFSQTKETLAVEKAVEQLRKAMIDADKNALEKLTADNLSYGHSSGRIENRSQFVESLVSGKSDFLTMDLTDQTVTVTGNTAIVRHSLSGNINDSGNPGTVKLVVMLVWVKQGKHWKLLGRQAVRPPQ
jgi:ketosteroid isomerase-like protein